MEVNHLELDNKNYSGEVEEIYKNWQDSKAEVGLGWR